MGQGAYDLSALMVAALKTSKSVANDYLNCNGTTANALVKRGLAVKVDGRYYALTTDGIAERERLLNLDAEQERRNAEADAKLAADLAKIAAREAVIRMDIVEAGRTITSSKLIGILPVSIESDEFTLYVRSGRGIVTVDRSDTDETLASGRNFRSAMVNLATRYGVRVKVESDYGVTLNSSVRAFLGTYEPVSDDRCKGCGQLEGHADNCPADVCPDCGATNMQAHAEGCSVLAEWDRLNQVTESQVISEPETAPEVKRCGCGNRGCGHVGGCESPATVGTLCVPCHVTLDSVRPDSCDVPADQCPVKVHTCEQPYVTGCVACEFAAPTPCRVEGCVFRTDAVEVLFRHVDTEHGAATGQVFEIFNTGGVDDFACSGAHARAYIAQEISEPWQAQYWRENVRRIPRVPLIMENGERVPWFDRCCVCKKMLPREPESVATPTPTAGEVFRMTSDPVGWFDTLTRTGEPVPPFRARNGKRKTFVQRHTPRKRVNR